MPSAMMWRGAADDISAIADRRVAHRKFNTAPIYTNDRSFRIDGLVSTSNSPVDSTPPTPRMYEPKGILSDISRDKKRRLPGPVYPLFMDESKVTRSSVPPCIFVEISGQEVLALIHSASHITAVSYSLVKDTSLFRDVTTDHAIPASPLSPNPASSWRVVGKITYLEISIKRSKFVTSAYVAEHLPADVVLGVDFMKKAQIKIVFGESTVIVPSKIEDIKVPFVSLREMNSYHQSKLGSRMNSLSGSF